MTWTNAIDLFNGGAQIFVSAVILFLAIVGLKGAKITERMITAFHHMVEAFTSQQQLLADVHGWTVPPEEWADVIELYQQIQEKGGEHGDYLIWCSQHNGYWAFNDHGYTPDRLLAKRFSAAEGLILVLDRARNSDPYDCYTLLRVPPEEPLHED